MTDFLIYLTYIGNDDYHIFIKNNSSEANFIRIIVGYTEIIKSERTGQVLRSWIISPLKSTNEHSFVGSISKDSMRGKRLWIAFEAVKHNKPKNTTIQSFMSLSSVVSKWRRTIGSTTHFEVQQITSIRGIENSLKCDRLLS